MRYIEDCRIIIEQGLGLLLDELGYRQIDIVEKLDLIHRKVSAATINNLVNGKKTVGNATIRLIAEGLEQIIKTEQGLIYDEANRKFIADERAKERTVMLTTDKRNKSENSLDHILHAGGRRGIKDKIRLINHAQADVIEIGLRLNSFTKYFTGRREDEFKEPVKQRLQSGVHFHCYLLNPKGRFAHSYFQDRDKVQVGELKKFEEVEGIIEELKTLFGQLNSDDPKTGKMHLYFYNCFPYFHASIADGHSPNGLMYFSPYLYGITRANTPIMEVEQRYNKKLFGKYWRSIQAVRGRAKKVDL